MKLHMIKEETNELIVEFDTKDLTIPDLIANKLLQYDEVEFAGVGKEHPEVGKARLAIKTSKKSAKSMLNKALEELDEEFASIKTAVGKK